MKTTHTPGPWEISSDENGSLDVCAENAGDMLANLGDCVNADANARLVAAAPDLLEALRTALDVLAHAQHFYSGGHSLENFRIAIDGAESAIAKATNSNS